MNQSTSNLSSLFFTNPMVMDPVDVSDCVVLWRNALRYSWSININYKMIFSKEDYLWRRKCLQKEAFLVENYQCWRCVLQRSSLLVSVELHLLSLLTFFVVEKKLSSAFFYFVFFLLMLVGIIRLYCIRSTSLCFYVCLKNLPVFYTTIRLCSFLENAF